MVELGVMSLNPCVSLWAGTTKVGLIDGSAWRTSTVPMDALRDLIRALIAFHHPIDRHCSQRPFGVGAAELVYCARGFPHGQSEGWPSNAHTSMRMATTHNNTTRMVMMWSGFSEVGSAIMVLVLISGVTGF